jgi:hypothetical protein
MPGILRYVKAALFFVLMTVLLLIVWVILQLLGGV